jgi:DNA repair exonuclease SbcCD nuclease subunit
MVRFLHTGDWQLGMTRRFLPAEAQARFAAARLDAVRAVGALAVEHGCDFVVCAGDVFESNALDRQVVVRALEAMAACPVPLYLLPGNHDPLDAASVYTSPTFARARPDHVAVLDGQGAQRPVPGVEVLGAPWTSKRPLADLVAAACEPLAEEPGLLRVLVAHGAVDVGAPDPDDPALIGLAGAEDALADGRIHYLALGDRHSRTRVGGTGRIWYAGAPEPTDFDEVDPGAVLLVDLDEAGCEVETLRVGTWRFAARIAEVGDAADVDALLARLAEEPHKDRAVVRLSLVGTLPLREAARLREELDVAADRFACLQVWEPGSDLVVLPDDGDVAALGLSGFAERAVADLRDLAAGPDADAATAQRALELLYRLARTEGRQGVGS